MALNNPSDRAYPLSRIPRPASSRSSLASPGELGSTPSRKRPRADTSERATQSSYASPRSWTDLGASNASVGAASPAPLANSRYRLAGGMDTPTRETNAHLENLDFNSENDFRRRWTYSSRSLEHGVQAVTMGALDRERNGRRGGTAAAQSMQEETWGQFVVNAVSGIAGKVWQFSVGAFRGFNAGGGDGYIMTSDGLQRTRREVVDTPGPTRRASNLTPVPGRFPQEYDEDIGEAHDLRPAKRLQTTREDWVMVDAPSPQLTPRTLSHRAHAPRPALWPNSSRRPRTSVARLSSASHTGLTPTGTAHKRAASFATPRSPAASPQAQRSPTSMAVDDDVQRYSAKRKREIKQADASMKRLNQQLQAMIKQGKDALASTVQIEDEMDDYQGGGADDDDDEGFFENESDVYAPRRRC